MKTTKTRGISPEIHAWLISIGDHVIAEEAIRRREEIRTIHFFEDRENNRRKEEQKNCI